jgi:septal ring factor EnvC (AmiA/AmiB activator)
MEASLLTFFGPIIIALIALGGSVLLFFQNRSTNKRLEGQTKETIAIEKEKLDGLVLDRAKSLYEGMIHQLESQATKLRETIERLEGDLDEEREENTKLRLRVRELEDQADTLEEEVYQLKIKLDRIVQN